MPENDIKILLFDLGGVLCRLNDPIETFSLQQSGAEFMERWLKSPSVREFERGAIDSETFAQNIIAEAGLPYGAEEFLERFDSWPDRLFPGALELLEDIPEGFDRAVLSNTNAAHWNRADIGGQLANCFERIFLSYETGLLKPDLQAFAQVVSAFECEPENILFFDDSPLNITAAENYGCRSVLTNGVADLRTSLAEHGILPRQ